jgi:hypothetical protein
MMLLPNVIRISLLFLIVFVDWTRGFHVVSSLSGTANQPSLMSQFHNTNFNNYSRSPTSIDVKKKDYDDGAKVETNVKKNKGVIFIAPFIFLFGLDLVVNIAVITKRSLEVLFTGEYTIWTPWQ